MKAATRTLQRALPLLPPLFLQRGSRIYVQVNEPLSPLAPGLRSACTAVGGLSLGDLGSTCQRTKALDFTLCVLACLCVHTCVHSVLDMDLHVVSLCVHVGSVNPRHVHMSLCSSHSHLNLGCLQSHYWLELCLRTEVGQCCMALSYSLMHKNTSPVILWNPHPSFPTSTFSQGALLKGDCSRSTCNGPGGKLFLLWGTRRPWGRTNQGGLYPFSRTCTGWEGPLAWRQEEAECSPPSCYWPGSLQGAQLSKCIRLPLPLALCAVSSHQLACTPHGRQGRGPALQQHPVAFLWPTLSWLSASESWVPTLTLPLSFWLALNKSQPVVCKMGVSVERVGQDEAEGPVQL